jgi:hypothetical protein
VGTKNKVEKVGVFFSAEKSPQNHHDLPSIHHKFTTNNHAKTRTFLENPLQKRPFTTPKINLSNHAPKCS